MDKESEIKRIRLLRQDIPRVLGLIDEALQIVKDTKRLIDCGEIDNAFSAAQKAMDLIDGYMRGTELAGFYTENWQLTGAAEIHNSHHELKRAAIDLGNAIRPLHLLCRERDDYIASALKSLKEAEPILLGTRMIFAGLALREGINMGETDERT